MELNVQLVSKPSSARTGIGRYVHELEKGLSLANVSFSVARPIPPVPNGLGDLVRRSGYDVTRFFETFPVRAKVEQQAKITHLTSQTLGTLLMTQKLQRPVVITVHDILPFMLRNDANLSIYRNRIDRFADSMAMRGLTRADMLIADSEYTKATLIKALQIPESKIVVIHLGIDADTFHPIAVENDFHERFGLSPDRRYLLYVGSEDPRKDLPTLLRALPLVRNSCPDVELIKIGAAAFEQQRAMNRDLCVELGIVNDVHWIDEIAEDDLPRFYSLASVFTFPSRYEGFGFPVLEALACGTPVVACRASSIPELVEGVATLVPLSDPRSMAQAIIDVLDSNDIRPDSLVQHARSFTWNHTIEQVLDVYRCALNGSRETALEASFNEETLE